MIAFNLRPLPRILARFIGFSRRRKYEFTADVLALWHIHRYIPGEPLILTEVGPVHLTLAAHESVRKFSLPRVGWHGLFLRRDQYTWTLTMMAFCFTFTLMFCHRPNIEKVEVTDLSREMTKRFR